MLGLSQPIEEGATEAGRLGEAGDAVGHLTAEESGLECLTAKGRSHTRRSTGGRCEFELVEHHAAANGRPFGVRDRVRALVAVDATMARALAVAAVELFAGGREAGIEPLA